MRKYNLCEDPNWHAEVGTLLVIRHQIHHPKAVEEAPFAVVTEHKKGCKSFKIKATRVQLRKVREKSWFAGDESETDYWLINPVTDDNLVGDGIKSPLLPGEFVCKFCRAKDTMAWEVHTEKDGKPYARFPLALYEPEEKYYY